MSHFLAVSNNTKSKVLHNLPCIWDLLSFYRSVLKDPMGEEIDAYILKKLDDAIKEASSSDFNIAAKLFFLKPTLAEQFGALKKLLTKKQLPAPAAAAAITDDSNTAPAPAAATAGGGAADDSNTRREQLYYLNNVLTEWQIITKKPFSIRESVSSLKDLRQSLKKIKQDLKRGDEGSIHTQPSDPPIHSDSVSNSKANGTAQAESCEEPREYRWSTRYVEKNVHGIEDKLLSMERLLVLGRDNNDPFKAFGIFGMAGIGKTTLCQSIFSRPKVIEYFFPRIWVCMSKQKDEDIDNGKEIVKRMLMCLGLDKEIINKTDEWKGLPGLVFALRLQLTGKRYLIVLDDAWSNAEWFKLMEDENSSSDKFAYGLPRGCGGTVIVTGRMKEVVKNMVGEERNLRCLVPLTDNDTCWNIFKDWVEKDEIAFPPELEELEEEIVKRCDGLPLAAKMMGEICHQKYLQIAKANQAEAVQHAS